MARNEPGRNEPGKGGRSQDGAVFELEQFSWAAPERLDVAGRFQGLREIPQDRPVLVVRGGERTHRLPALPDSLSGPPRNGRPWHASFAWQSAPIAFDAAELEIGDGVVVSLPEATAGGGSPDPRRRSGAAADGAARTPDDGVVDGAARLRLEAEALAAREEIRALEGALQQSRDDLERARKDLAAERERHDADAARFREGLARVQSSAESVLAEEQAALEQLHVAHRDLVESAAEKDASLEKLRKQLAEAAQERAEAESQLEAQVAQLTERVGELEAAERRISELQAEADEARSALGAFTEAAETARADTERLLARLTTLRDTTTHGAGR